MQSDFFCIIVNYKKDTQTCEQLMLQFETKKLLKKEQ
jgi:hypothetical protein